MVNFLLYIGLKYTDFRILYPFHFLVARVYRHIVIPILLLYFQKKSKCVKKIICRHSVLDFHFNCFASDLDYSIIIKDSAGQDEINELVDHAVWLKRIFIFLDYPEIYRIGEHNVQTQLRNKHPVPYSLVYFLKNLRKIPQSYQKYKKPSSPYHKLKAYRSIRHCFQKIGSERHFMDYFKNQMIYINSSKMLKMSINIKNVDTQNFFSIFSHHLNVKFSSLLGGSESKLSLLTIIPEPFDEAPKELIEKIRLLRQKNSFKNCFQIQNFENLILCASTLRTRRYLHYRNSLNISSHIQAIRYHLKNLDQIKVSGKNLLLENIKTEVDALEDKKI